MSLGLSSPARVTAALSATLALALSGCGSKDTPTAGHTTPVDLTRTSGSSDADKAYLRLTIPVEQRLQAFAAAGKDAHRKQIRLVLAPTTQTGATSAEHRLESAARRLGIDLNAGTRANDAAALGVSPMFASAPDLTIGLKSAPSFDRAYIQAAQLTYIKVVTLTNAVIRRGRDPQLRGLALALNREAQQQVGLVSRLSRVVNRRTVSPTSVPQS